MSDNNTLNPTTTFAQSRLSAQKPSNTPRVARFAEATTVYSPISPSHSPIPFPSTNHLCPQPQPSDIGLNYIDAKHSSYNTVEMEDEDSNHLPRGGAAPRTMTDVPLSPPLKSAMKTPGAAPRNLGNVLSPTFREENVLEKREKETEKEQAADIVSIPSNMIQFELRSLTDE